MSHFRSFETMAGEVLIMLRGSGTKRGGLEVTVFEQSIDIGGLFIAVSADIPSAGVQEFFNEYDQKAAERFVDSLRGALKL